MSMNPSLVSEGSDPNKLHSEQMIYFVPAVRKCALVWLQAIYHYSGYKKMAVQLPNAYL